MKILHVTGMHFSTKYGGFERWLSDICRYAEARNDNIYISYSERIGDVKPYIDSVHQKNGNFVILKNDNEILSFCKNEGIDYVHFHFFFEGYKPLYKQLRSCGTKLFIHLHCENYYYVNDEWKHNLKSLFHITAHRIKTHYSEKFFQNILGCSKKVCDEYETMYRWSRAKLRVHYIGIQSYVYQGSHIMSQIPTVTSIAFHSYIKGTDVLLRALAILKEKSIPFKFVQIGGGSVGSDGEDTRQLKELCFSLGLDDRVEWVGTTNNVYKYLQHSDIYCQPSRTEALSLSIAEAMQAGLPIVASDVGGVSELVQHNVNGYLVEPDNIEELANRLELLIKDKNICEQFGKSSLSIFNSMCFTTEKSVELLWKYYV